VATIVLDEGFSCSLKLNVFTLIIMISRKFSSRIGSGQNKIKEYDLKLEMGKLESIRVD